MTALDTELFLPEPEARTERYTVISVDDHVVEPAHTFEGRLPAAVQARLLGSSKPRRGTRCGSSRVSATTQVGMNAVAGRRPETYGLEPFRFDQMRPGCYDVDARVRDMDINGVWASVNFPSQITGFCGRVFFACPIANSGWRASARGTTGFSTSGYLPHPDRSCRSGSRTLSDPELACGRDLSQRRTRLHVSHLPRASPRDRTPVVVGARATGIRSCEPSSRPTR